MESFLFFCLEPLDCTFQHVHLSLINPHCNQFLLVALVEILFSSELFGSPLASLQQQGFDGIAGLANDVGRAGGPIISS